MGDELTIKRQTGSSGGSEHVETTGVQLSGNSSRSDRRSDEMVKSHPVNQFSESPAYGDVDARQRDLSRRTKKKCQKVIKVIRASDLDDQDYTTAHLV
jgi:hypothetical protein